MAGFSRDRVVCLHVVQDPFVSYAFRFLHTGKLPETMVPLLLKDVLQFCCNRRLTIQAVRMDHSTVFCERAFQSYELHLALNVTEDGRPKVRSL